MIDALGQVPGPAGMHRGDRRFIGGLHIERLQGDAVGRLGDETFGKIAAFENAVDRGTPCGFIVAVETLRQGEIGIGGGHRLAR